MAAYARPDRPPRSRSLEFRSEPVPGPLRDREQWMAWPYKFDTEYDEWKKLPIEATIGRFAKSTERATWESGRRGGR